MSGVTEVLCYGRRGLHQAKAAESARCRLCKVNESPVIRYRISAVASSMLAGCAVYSRLTHRQAGAVTHPRQRSRREPRRDRCKHDRSDSDRPRRQGKPQRCGFIGIVPGRLRRMEHRRRFTTMNSSPVRWVRTDAFTPKRQPPRRRNASPSGQEPGPETSLRRPEIRRSVSRRSRRAGSIS